MRLRPESVPAVTLQSTASQTTDLAEKYGVRVTPTVIIDEEVKIEGRPDIPFVCSDEAYAHFREVYPLTVQLIRPSDPR